MNLKTTTNRFTYIVLSLLLSIPGMAQQKGARSGMEAYLRAQGIVDVNKLYPTIKYDLKYATTDNFTKTILYDDLLNIYLHPVAAAKLVEAQKNLKKVNQGYCLLVYDAVRPLSVQKKIYDVVRNTKYAAYVANPSRTGLHNYGMAVDLTICDRNGKPLDMGTPFDYFGSAAGISEEAELVKKGLLTAQQVENRKLLRKVMLDAGFKTIRGEWWHFNAVTLQEAKKSYKVIE